MGLNRPECKVWSVELSVPGTLMLPEFYFVSETGYLYLAGQEQGGETVHPTTHTHTHSTVLYTHTHTYTHPAQCWVRMIGRVFFCCQVRCFTAVFVPESVGLWRTEGHAVELNISALM